MVEVKKKPNFKTKSGKKISFRKKKKVKKSSRVKVRRSKIKTRWNRFGNLK